MKPYLDKDWLFTEYIVKGKSTIKIALENGCTDANILRVMKRFSIPRKDRTWSEEEIEILLDAAGNHTFIEVSKLLDKTYEAVRIKASQLGIKSAYKPGIRDNKTRQKISASLQGISGDEWDGFKETTNKLIRKSIPYQEWRKAVFARDNYTCQHCGIRGVYLHADHIKRFADYPELRLELTNGRTLCADCHRKTPTWGGRKVVV